MCAGGFARGFFGVGFGGTVTVALKFHGFAAKRSSIAGGTTGTGGFFAFTTFGFWFFRFAAIRWGCLRLAMWGFFANKSTFWFFAICWAVAFPIAQRFFTN